MNAQRPDPSVIEDPNALLERALIEEYLNEQGYSLEKLRDLPKNVAKKLMIEATRFASLKLEEIEDRARFIGEIHDDTV